MFSSGSTFEMIFRRALHHAHSRQWLQALHGFEIALSKEPNSAETLYNLGLVHEHMKAYELALACYENALTLDPSFIFAHINRGILLHEKLQFHEAIHAYDRAISLNPIVVDAWLNKGNSLHSLGRYSDALHAYKEALAIEPGSAEVLWNKSLIDLTNGEFLIGWNGYENRFKAKKGIASLFGKIRRLDRLEKIKGKKILVWHEQGYGDSIQFCRFLNLISNLGGEVIFYAPAPLQRILNESFTFKCTDEPSNIGKVDYQIPLLSLPWLFSINPYLFLDEAPYLKVSKVSVEQWREKLKIEKGGRLNIGLAISGSSLHVANSLRSIKLELLSNIDANFYLVQKDLSKASLEQVARDKKYINCGDLVEDFYDSASILRSMDLVVTVDTSLAHLSGALGIETLLLLPYVPEWRWLKDSDKSPWYQSMTLIRQAKFNDWEGVIARLTKYIEDK